MTDEDKGEGVDEEEDEPDEDIMWLVSNLMRKDHNALDAPGAGYSGERDVRFQTLWAAASIYVGVQRAIAEATDYLIEATSTSCRDQ